MYTYIVYKLEFDADKNEFVPRAAIISKWVNQNKKRKQELNYNKVERNLSQLDFGRERERGRFCWQRSKTELGSDNWTMNIIVRGFPCRNLTRSLLSSQWSIKWWLSNQACLCASLPASHLARQPQYNNSMVVQWNDKSQTPTCWLPR